MAKYYTIKAENRPGRQITGFTIHTQNMASDFVTVTGDYFGNQGKVTSACNTSTEAACMKAEKEWDLNRDKIKASHRENFLLNSAGLLLKDGQQQSHAQ